MISEKPWVLEAKGSINLAKLAAQKIGELLDPALAAELPQKAQALQKAVELEDQQNGEALTARIDDILHDLDKIPQMAFQSYLLTFRLQATNPAKAQEFRDRLEVLAPLLAGGPLEAEKDLARLFCELRDLVMHGQDRGRTEGRTAGIPAGPEF